MKNLPTLRQMQYLIALHRAKNFRVAAENCNITQPTLSAAIKEMELLLGLSVIDRSHHRKVVFTNFGQEVLKTALRILPHLETMMQTARTMSAPLSGPMRLGLIPTIAPYLLPVILPGLQKNFPNIEWQIIETMSANLVEKINNAELDMAIIAFPYDIGGLEYQIFFEEEFVCAARKGTYNKDQKLTLSDLNDQKLLLLEDGHCLREHALSACKLQDQRDEKALKATSLQTLIQMAGHGYGITLLPEMVIGQGVIPKDVTLHYFKKPAPTRKIGAIWRAQSSNKNDIDHIVKELKQVL